MGGLVVSRGGCSGSWRSGCGAARFLVSVVLPRSASRALRCRCASPSAMTLRVTLDSARSSTGEKRAGGRGRVGVPGTSVPDVGLPVARCEGRVRVSPARRAGLASATRWVGVCRPVGGWVGRWVPLLVGGWVGGAWWVQRLPPGGGDWSYGGAGGLSKTEDRIAILSSVFGRGPGGGGVLALRRTQPLAAARLQSVDCPWPPACPRTAASSWQAAHWPLAAEAAWRACEVLVRSSCRGLGGRPGGPACVGHPFSGPLARFSLVLERAESRVARRAIGGADAERQRSALYSGRGGTTLARKRVAPRCVRTPSRPPTRRRSRVHRSLCCPGRARRR